MSGVNAMLEHCDSCTCRGGDEDLAAVEHAIMAEKNARIAELERDLERWIETAANFLATGATVEAELAAVTPIVEAAKAWRSAKTVADCGAALDRLIAATDQALSAAGPT